MSKLIPTNILATAKTLSAVKKESLKHYETKTVLGIDIYKYSEYNEFSQMYIPPLFLMLYESTVRNLLRTESYFFEKYAQDNSHFAKRFISTGDGGFQIFDDPFQALIFAIYFQLQTRRFNSGGDSSFSPYAKRLTDIVGKVELRYAITLDKVFEFDNNYYGPAIINNSRILSKDSLNRVLLDENVPHWFDSHINSIENLAHISKKDFDRLIYFKSYNPERKSVIFGKSSKITSLDIQKIGRIKAKSTNLDIYNLHLQVKGFAEREKKDGFNLYTITLGNLNTSGINDAFGPPT